MIYAVYTLCLCVQVTVILTYWVAEQYSEFEEMTEMLDFLDWFEIRLVEDVSQSSLSNVVCAFNFEDPISYM